MTVLVDTSVWSLAFRREERNLNIQEARIRTELADLIRQGRARVIGPIRQELLSGIKDEVKFRRVQQRMRTLDDEQLETDDYEEAARISNALRSKGITATPIDCLICAVSIRLGLSVFTTDRDFSHHAKFFPITVHSFS